MANSITRFSSTYARFESVPLTLIYFEGMQFNTSVNSRYIHQAEAMRRSDPMGRYDLNAMNVLH